MAHVDSALFKVYIPLYEAAEFAHAHSCFKEDYKLIIVFLISFISSDKLHSGLLLILCERNSLFRIIYDNIGQFEYKGVFRRIKGFEDWVSKGNRIVFICLGAGSAGYATYQPADFIGMNGKTICGYNENLTPLSTMLIVSILDCEHPKYSFGRS